MFRKVAIIISDLTASGCGKSYNSVDAAEFADFMEQIDRLDRDRPVEVNCRSGRRSKIAADRSSAKGSKLLN